MAEPRPWSVPFLILASWLASFTPASSQDPAEDPVGPWRVCRDVLVREVEAGLARGAARRAALAAPEAVRAWQRANRSWLRGAMVPLPPEGRDPPAVVTVRTLEREGYRIEHLLIESRPGMHVTAHLYLPDPSRFSAPVPGVLVACGHSAEGKASASYQRGAATLATYGCAALVYDPLDQGERAQARRSDGRPVRWGTRAHNVVGAQALLVGWSQAGLEAWDGVRCLDALASRPEVDAGRLGVCGNSGGGTQSAQLFAVDDRLQVAAPSCYLTSLADLVRTIGPQDAEQNLLGQVARGLDHADYAAVRAPAAVLVCAATRDFFPIDGTRRAVREAGQVYEALGASDAIALVEVDATHGWHPELIEATTAWMARWLDGREIEPHCVAAPPMVDAAAARVTATGCVLDLEGERSVFALLEDAAAIAERRRLQRTPAERVARARELCAVRALDALPGAVLAEIDAPPASVRKLRIHLADGMDLAGARRGPLVESDGLPTLVVGAGAWSVDPNLATEVFPDRQVVWIDPLAVADGAPDEAPWYGAFGPSGRDAAFGILLGRSLVGRQVEQILAVARQVAGAERAVDLVARGPAALAALHAAAFEPQLFATIDVETPIPSWAALMGEMPDVTLLPFVVPGALTAYDLDDLREAAGRGAGRGSGR